ncbi:hypothetical protein CEXT_193651 [Caerostris extrusa]|uniref:Uncharacterized protein n=1 Tax=Caerostris extrusa TaxID=172846 RepID=A0AAV4XM18_CAEEX|nr:hypothetical protein CEXT_193651 [Caerostris extrusa]
MLLQILLPKRRKKNPGKGGGRIRHVNGGGGEEAFLPSPFGDVSAVRAPVSGSTGAAKTDKTRCGPKRGAGRITALHKY